MSAETSLQFFMDQYGIVYQSGKIFAEKLHGNYRVFHWDGALRRLDTDRIRQQLEVDTLDDIALKRLERMDADAFVAHTVFGKVQGPKAVSAPVMAQADQMGVMRVQAEFLRDAIDLSCLGFEYVKYTEDGVMLSFDDFEELTATQLDTYLAKLAEYGAIRYRRHEVNKNQYLVRFRRDFMQYDATEAPIFFEAFTFLPA